MSLCVCLLAIQVDKRLFKNEICHRKFTKDQEIKKWVFVRWQKEEKKDTVCLTPVERLSYVQGNF